MSDHPSPRETQERYRLLVEAMPSAVVIHQQGTIVFANQAACRMARLESPEQMLGRSVLDFVHGSSLELVKRRMQAALEGQVQVVEETLQAADGTQLTAEVTAVPVSWKGDPAVQVIFRDVSQRKTAEAARRKSEALFKSLVEHAPSYILTVDRTHRILFANRVHPGLTPEEVIGASIYDFAREEDEAMARAAIDRVFATGEPEGYEAGVQAHVDPAGWFVIRLGPVLQDGEVVAVTMIATDISHMRQVKEALRWRNKVLEALAGQRSLDDCLDLLVQMVEQVTGHLRCAVLVLGEDTDAFRSCRAPTLPACRPPIGPTGAPPICAQAARDTQRHIVKNLRAARGCEPCWLLADEGLRTCWSQPIVSKAGVALGTLAVFCPKEEAPDDWHAEFLDSAARLAGIAIERRRVEERLLDNERRYRSLVEHAPVAIFEVDFSEAVERLDHLLHSTQSVSDQLIEHPELLATFVSHLRVLGVNQTGIQLFDARDGVQLAQRSAELVGQETYLSAAPSLEAILKRLPMFAQDLQLVTLKGDLREVIYRYTIVPGHEEKLDRVLVTLTDVTERRETDRERDKLVKVLAHKNEELESIVHVASHDLRAPLINIEGFSQELLDASVELRRALAQSEPNAALIADLLDEQIPSAVRFIATSAGKMDHLLNGLLALSRLGRADVSVTAIDMNELVETVLQSMQYQLQESGATIEVGDLPPCQGDPPQLGQVFANLLDNALKYLDPDRPGRIEIGGRSTDLYRVYWVADNGIGIRADHQPFVFELFHRLRPGGPIKGEGLGLTIVRRVIARHGGKAWLESEAGQGSRFLVSLPNPSARSQTPPPTPTNVATPS